MRSTQIELTPPDSNWAVMRNLWHTEFSSPLEQNTRIKEHDGNVTIEYGFGEAFRNTEAYLSADDFASGWTETPEDGLPGKNLGKLSKNESLTISMNILASCVRNYQV